MSHKRAKKVRQQARQLVPNISAMPMHDYREEYTGKWKRATAEDIKSFISIIGYAPIKQVFLTKQCKKYWYKCV